MSKVVTAGKARNTLSRIYDRLRKRSFRNLAVDRTSDEHEWYVKGVRDGLNAAEEAGLLAITNTSVLEGARVRYVGSYWVFPELHNKVGVIHNVPDEGAPQYYTVMFDVDGDLSGYLCRDEELEIVSL